MKARSWLTRLLLFGAFAAGATAGPGCSPAGSNSPGGGTGGYTGGGSGGSTGGPTCAVTIQAVTPSSLTGLVAGPDAFVRLRGEVTGFLVPSSGTWSWAAMLADGTGLPVRTPQDDPALIEVPLPRTGSYAVTATFADRTLACAGTTGWVVSPSGAKTAFFTFRVAPPAGGAPEQQTAPVAVVGGSPIGNHVISLDTGTAVSLTAVGPTGQGVAAYLRATETTSGLVQERHTSATEKVAQLALPTGRYDVLVIPDGDFAPVLLADKRPDQLAVMGAIPVGDGTPVSGRVLDSTGQPIVGAHATLRVGALPSTVGTTDATGTFHLLCRPGSVSARLALGPASPAWDLTADQVVPVTAKGGSMDVRVAALPTARLDLTMTGAGAGAKVLIESLAPVADAATISWTDGGASGGAATAMNVAATARVRAQLPVADDGTVHAVGLPRAHYRVTVFAAQAAPRATVTTLADLDASAGDVSRTMAMAAPIPVQGSLLPADAAANARVLALDEATPLVLAPDTASPIAAIAGSTGAFALSLNPSRMYRLVVEPPPDGTYARALLAPIMVASAPIALPAQPLPRALLHAGVVVNGVIPVAGAVISARCVPAGAATTGADPACPDPEHAVAQAITALDGSYRLYLPDPDPEVAP